MKRIKKKQRLGTESVKNKIEKMILPYISVGK